MNAPDRTSLVIRILLIGYCFGIRSERRLCEDVDINLAYRWFCRLGLEGYIRTQGPLIKSQMPPSEQLVSLPG